MEDGGLNSGKVSLLSAAFLLAACSLVYELLIAQVVSVFAGNTVIWYSLTIGIFLVGMGIGSFAAAPILVRRSGSVVLFWTEAALCALGALSPYLLHFCALTVLWFSAADEWVVGGAAFFLPAAVLILLIGLLTGIELPVLIERAASKDSGGRLSPSKLLAADYFGSLVGALAFSLLLWPNFESTEIAVGAAAVNLMVAMVLTASPKRTNGSLLRIACAGVLGGVLTALLLLNAQFMHFFLPRYYAYTSGESTLAEMLSPSKPLPMVTRYRSKYHTIDLVRSAYHDRSFYIFDLFSSKFKERPDFPPRILLFLNGEVQFFGDFEEVYHEFFAHVPIAAYGNVPEQVLILGGGDGLLLRELLKYDKIKKITLVDLDPEMLQFARSNPVMRLINRGSFDDPRVSAVSADAYHFIKNSTDEFDAVFMDFPEVSDFNLSRLYSVEFYSFVSAHLSERGFAVMNSGQIEYLSIPDEKGLEEISPRNDWAGAYNTLRLSGFKQITPFYSRLEYDLPRAAAQVSEKNLVNLPADASPDKMKQAAALFLRYNAASLRSGFIMAAKQPRPLASSFESAAEPLHVINGKRYRAALETPLPKFPKATNRRANSVFRPQPSWRPIWSIRRPLRGYGEVFSD